MAARTTCVLFSWLCSTSSTMLGSRRLGRGASRGGGDGASGHGAHTLEYPYEEL